MENKKSIAVLITCYNRVNTTLKCLEHLYNASVPKGFYFDVYLVDDNSPDETGKIVKENYPKIKVIQGTGSLYWNGGMRLAWQTAAQSNDYDFYLWLNDDTYIEKNGLKVMVENYLVLEDQNIISLISGALNDPETKMMTYVGRTNSEKLIQPSGFPQFCESIPGNFVLVSKTIFKSVGYLDKMFSHGLGDTDYGFRVQKAGFKCSITSTYVGYCQANTKKMWHDSSLKLKQRTKLLFSKTNGNIWEYLLFKRRHHGNINMILTSIKTFLRLFLPQIYE